MESFKEFQGKDLDAAIGEACSYFNTEREKLEIEILQDAKSGIFGIVGARKAKVRARRARLRQTVESILNRRNDTRQEEAAPPSPASSSSPAAPAVGGRKEAEGAAVDTASVSAADAPAGREAQPTPRKAPARDKSEPQPASQAAPQAAPQAASSATNAGRNSGMNSGMNSGTSSGTNFGTGGQGCEQPALADDLDEAAEGLQPTPVEELDARRLQSLTEEVVRQLVRPVVGEDVQLEVSVGNGRVQVQVDCGEDSGLLIGREGQTLASLRYLASRL
ncbi:MAG: Jag N-terminal domain-containing protein, partial [Desulfovibrionaceae bacterium]|nr:Jag N-terminal domain-containing protein [Desulfovibrionaceae bacterium]